MARADSSGATPIAFPGPLPIDITNPAAYHQRRCSSESISLAGLVGPRSSSVSGFESVNVSDESNERVLYGQSVHLRVSRSADVFAFHFSSDVERWRLSRLFRLRDPSAPTAVGFLAQSPTGDGCDPGGIDCGLR